MSMYHDDDLAAHVADEMASYMDQPLTSEERETIARLDTLDCPRMGCSVGSFPGSMATKDNDGNLCCPRCGAVVVSAESIE